MMSDVKVIVSPFDALLMALARLLGVLTSKSLANAGRASDEAPAPSKVISASRPAPLPASEPDARRGRETILPAMLAPSFRPFCFRRGACRPPPSRGFGLTRRCSSAIADAATPLTRGSPAFARGVQRLGSQGKAGWTPFSSPRATTANCANRTTGVESRPGAFAMPASAP